MIKEPRLRELEREAQEATTQQAYANLTGSELLELVKAYRDNLDDAAAAGPVMVRPPWESMNPGGYVACSCGSMLQNREQLREHWQRGHFDELQAKNGSSRS